MRRDELGLERLGPRLRARAVAIGALALMVGWPSLAGAGEAEARSLFAEGRQLRLAGNCDEAIPLFRKALETYPDALGSLRNLAECEVELGRFASARRSYWDLRIASLKSSDPKYAGWERDATEAHAALAPRVAKLRIEVRGPSSARVFLNGTPFDPRLHGVEIEHDLGKLVVELRDGSNHPKKEQRELVEGERYEVRLVSDVPLDPPDEPGEAGESALPVVDTPTGRDTASVGSTGTDAAWMRTSGIVALAVSGAASVGLGVSLAVRGSSLSSVEQGCRSEGAGFVCPSSLQSEVETGQTTSTLATVFGVTAGVSAAAGVGLLIAAALSDEPGEPSMAFDATPTQGGGYASLRWSF